MHHAKVEETISQAKALMKAMKTGGMVAAVSLSCLDFEYSQKLFVTMKLYNFSKTSTFSNKQLFLTK